MMIKGFLTFGCHDLFEFGEGDREVGIVVNADIVDLGVEWILHVAMAVTMQHPRTVMHLVPRHQGKVTHDDQSAIIRVLFMQRSHGLKLIPTIFAEALLGVVVALDHLDVAVQATKDLEIPLRLGKGEVSEEEDCTILGNLLVPVRDQRLVHFFHVGKGPVGVLDDVGVTKVGVACPESLFFVHDVSFAALDLLKRIIASFFEKVNVNDEENLPKVSRRVNPSRR